MSSNSISPNHREILSARSTITGKQEYITSTSGILNINGSFSISGSAIPISGATTAVGVAIVDSSGNQISSFGGGTQYIDGGVPPAHPTGNTIEWSDGSNWQTVSTAKPLPVTATFSPSGTQDVNLTKIAGSSIALGQTTMSASLPVTIASNQASIPVAATLSAETTKVIGTVNQGTSPWVSSGGGTAGSAASGVMTIQGIASMTPVQVSQATASNLNATVVGTGTFVTQATLAAETTKVIGVTRTADGSGNLLTSTANALDINIKSGNPTTIAATQSGTWTVQPGNTANTTAWKVDGSAVTQPVSYATTGSGTATGALRVELPTNGTGVIATVGAVTAITNALPAGTNGIGKLTSNSGVTIGAVEIASAQTLATVTNVATIGTSVTPGTAAANLGKAEDAAHTTGDVGVFSLAVRNDTLADVTNTTADYSQISADLKGRVMTAGAPRALKANTQTSLSNTTSETTIIAATASTFHDVYGLILANTGATTTKVSIRDDTAGTVRAIIEVPTLETRGFMLPVDSAVTQTAVNKNWTAQCASATTALEVTTFYVSMV